MKKILIAILFCTASILNAQEVPDNNLSAWIRENPQRASLNLHTYEFNEVHDTPAPKGYQPFYISHYGRHGSRSSGNKEYLKLKNILIKAQADGQLTPAGEKVLAVTELAIQAHAGMDGHLTERGRYEHAMLAERMYKRYPEVFKKGNKKIFAVSSTVPRCLVSMCAFTNRLMALQSDLEIDLETGELYMKYIGRGEGDKIREVVPPVTDSLKKLSAPDTTAILSVLFKDPVGARKYMKKSYSLTSYVNTLAGTIQAFDIDEDIFSLLPESVIYHYAERSALNFYLHHGNSARFGDYRIPRASRVADDIITRANEVINGAERVADLRFGHDWPLLALMGYLGLEGVSERLTIDEARGYWNPGLYVPFAGNLQIILYRNKQNDVLVKFLLNEKETLIPALTPVSGPYYKWSDFVSMINASAKS